MITLHQGDCLKIIPQFVPDESVDLVYIDPPFYTGHDFDTLTDKWLSMDTYVRWLAMRIRECYRVLKPTGSIYVHLDWHAVHYVKVAMDEIFDMKNLQNDIAWCYSGGGGSKKHFGRKHDNILFYTKSGKYTFNPDDVRVPYTEGGGTWQAQQKGKVMDKKIGKGVHKWKPSDKGKVPEDWWTIPFINPMAKERIGYPTQKPEALLERIIEASSNPGDLILDPMCGCGTALAVAQRLGRRYVGIDLSEEAIALSTRRLSSCQSELKSAT